MSYTYASRKRTDGAAQPQASAVPQEPAEALSSGAFRMSGEQLGHRVDLPEAIRAKMENAFGADLSAVRLYESQSVADAGAQAVSQGQKIAFAPGLLDFTSYSGQSLLGHELSHVVSQARGEVTGSGFLNDQALEARADREGAMAAAGQQIAMPTAALSDASAAPAAGPMQASLFSRLFGRKKKTPAQAAQPVTSDQAAPPAQTDPQVSFEHMSRLKKGLKHGSSSVAKVNVTGGAPGEQAVVKTGVNPVLEDVMARYYRKMGESYRQNHSGVWNFGATDARPLTAAEKDAARPLVDKGKLHSTKNDTDTEGELNNTAVFSLASGKSRKARQHNPGYKGNKEENADYQRMMGYIAMSDMATGNFDRLTGSFALGNWLENRDTKEVSLIDNDFNSTEGLRMGAEGRTDWLKKFMGFAKHKDQKTGKEEISGRQFIRNTVGINDFSIVDVDQTRREIMGFDEKFLGAHAVEGANQAVADMPAVRQQILDSAGAEGLSGYEQELAERMRIIHEYMTDPKLAKVYDKLRDIGFSQQKKLRNDGTLEPVPESEAVTRRRAELLARLQTRRERATAAASGGAAAPAPAPAPASEPAPASAPLPQLKLPEGYGMSGAGGMFLPEEWKKK